MAGPWVEFPIVEPLTHCPAKEPLPYTIYELNHEFVSLVKIRPGLVVREFAILVGQPLLAVPRCVGKTKADSQEWLSYAMRSVAFLETGGVGSQLSPC
jgi:hypothetical protein